MLEVQFYFYYFLSYFDNICVEYYLAIIDKHRDEISQGNHPKNLVFLMYKTFGGLFTSNSKCFLKSAKHQLSTIELDVVSFGISIFCLCLLKERIFLQNLMYFVFKYQNSLFCFQISLMQRRLDLIIWPTYMLVLIIINLRLLVNLINF